MLKAIGRLVSTIIGAFVVLLLWGMVEQDPSSLVVLVPALALGLGVGLLGDRAADRAERRRIDQEAAKQERQARLIADAISEREARQRLGEFTS